MSKQLRRLVPALVVACVAAAHGPDVATAAVDGAGPGQPRAAAGTERGRGALESAAAKAGDIGRAVAMSLIGLALAVAATVLAFRRDFRDAAGVFAVGIVAVLLATPTGVTLLRNTVASLFGAQ